MSLATEKHGHHSGLLLRDFEGAISIDKVSFRYSPNSDPAILGASFSIAPGEMVAIVGNTGSGKSTLLSLLAGLDTPTTGSICLQGNMLTEMDEDGRAALRNQYIGFVFQSFQYGKFGE